MSPKISAPVLEQLSGVISARMGLHFTPERLGDLSRGLHSASLEFGFDDPDACARWLCSVPLGKHHVEVLASHLTVGETYFFRESRIFQVLQENIIPKLIAARRGREQRLRIWSAGCCTGEEPYSVAMVLSRLLPDAHNWDLTLLATDINPRFLAKASAGVYGEWSFRDVPSEIKQYCFNRLPDGRYEILPEIRRQVTFDYLNLADDSFPSLLNNTNAMDVIFCRNVMIYLSPPQIQALLDKFRRCLCDGGWLMVGATETPHVKVPGLRLRCFPQGVAYEKIPEEPAPAPDAQALSVLPGPRPLRRIAPSRTFPREGAAFAGRKPPMPGGSKAPPADRSAAAPAASVMPGATSDTEKLQDVEKLYEQGRYADVIERLLPLMSLPRPSPGALGLMVRARANQGDLAGALEWSRRAIQADKLNPRFHYLHGAILQEMKDCISAYAAFRRALYLDPRFALAHVAAAHLARHQGRAAEASRHLSAAFELLRNRAADETLPEADGITAGQLSQIITALTEKAAQHA